MIYLGIATFDAGKYSEAVPILESVQQLRKEVLGENHRDTLNVGYYLGMCYEEQDLSEKSLSLLEDIAERYREHLGRNDTRTLRTVRRLATQYRKCERNDDAIKSAQEVVESRRSLPNSDPADLSGDLEELGHCLIQISDFAKAEGVLRECLTLRLDADPVGWQVGQAKSLLGETLLGQEKYVEAESTLLAGYEGLKELPPEIRRDYADQIRIESADRLVRLFEKLQKPEDVEKWRETLSTLRKKGP